MDKSRDGGDVMVGVDAWSGMTHRRGLDLLFLPFLRLLIPQPGVELGYTDLNIHSYHGDSLADCSAIV